jgi:hypothetical protein
VGRGVGSGVGEGVGVGVGESVGLGVLVGVARGVGREVGVGVGLSVGDVTGCGGEGGAPPTRSARNEARMMLRSRVTDTAASTVALGATRLERRWVENDRGSAMR